MILDLGLFLRSLSPAWPPMSGNPPNPFAITNRKNNRDYLYPFNMAPVLTLPDFQADWNWPRRLNPHTDEIRQESSDWAASFGAFSARAQKSFDKCNFSECSVLRAQLASLGKM